jgi:hypothetical protein
LSHSEADRARRVGEWLAPQYDDHHPLDWHADLIGGSPYENHGVHIVRMRWGEVVDIDANEESQLVAESMKVFVAHSARALADPIVR